MLTIENHFILKGRRLLDSIPRLLRIFLNVNVLSTRNLNLTVVALHYRSVEVGDQGFEAGKLFVEVLEIIHFLQLKLARIVMLRGPEVGNKIGISILFGVAFRIKLT